MTLDTEKTVKLCPVTNDELTNFKEQLQISFMKGLRDSFPEHENPIEIAPVPPEEDIDKILMEPNAAIFHIVMNEQKMGGVVLQIDEQAQHNEVIFLYLNANAHGKGIGTKAWQVIEASYPDTKVWELYTPYFEKRNIHFYVNKCGFKIVEFFHRGNPGPDFEVDETKPDAEYEFFRFEKVMK